MRSIPSLRVQVRSKGGRWNWALIQSPGETKSNEVELGSHRELDNHLRVQDRSRGRRWSWILKRAQETSRGGRWSWTLKRAQDRSRTGRWSWTLKRAQDRSRTGRWNWALIESWTIFCFRFQHLLFAHCLCDCSAQLWKQQLAKYTDCFPLAGSPTPYHQLLFWRWLTVSSVFAGRSARTSYSSLPVPLRFPRP